ncbi:serine/threonine protein kinase [Cupriavidus necator]|uniref:Serine/threonine protein kinase n=1 Tax=Cupriavidus necator TaxID=106590 RepID=A0A1U9UXY5_CUPNE|nr:serine/threonine-protein kinase [Cupriavidus necator]AQV97267.1 serine/threonine protein kinase [Cupriavidus necator]
MSVRQIGHYEIRTLLGRGGIGEVYGAFDTELERDVAIKTLRPELSLDKGFLDRFRAEATSLAKLNHPNITTLYALFKDGDTMCMVMELVHGNTLETILQRIGKFPVRDSLAVIIQAIMGLRYAHKMGVIHRDIKPSNLMLTESGTLKIMDFGIARIQGSQRLTQQGDVVGTLAYASPEQLRGHEGDGRSDLYSLATVLYELVSGRLPFNATSDYELIRAQVEAVPPSLALLCPDLDRGIENALMRALAKAPEERFDTVEDFGRALAALPLFADAPDIVREGVLQTYNTLDLQATRIAGVNTSTIQSVNTAANPDVNTVTRLRGHVDFAQRTTSAAAAPVPPPAATEPHTRPFAHPATYSTSGRPDSVLPRPRSRVLGLGATAAGLIIGAGILLMVLMRQPQPSPPSASSTTNVPHQISVPEPPAQEQPINLPPIALIPTPSAPASPSSPPRGQNGSNPPAQQARPDLEGKVAQVLDSGALIVSGKIVNLSSIRGEDGKPAQAMQRYLKGKGNQLQCFAKDKGFQCFADGEDIGEHAIRNGWARSRDGAPARYVTAEQEARRARVGVWAL